MEKLKLSAERVHIRNLRLDDLDYFHQYRCNPEVTRYQGFDVMNKEEAKNFIQSQLDKLFGKPGEWVQYAIALQETDELIGDCAIKLQAADPRIAEIGITISHLQQRKGFAKEVLSALVNFLFEEKSLHRIVETVDAENLASIKLLEAVGFRKEGHFIENIFFKGKWGSEFQYALLRKEW